MCELACSVTCSSHGTCRLIQRVLTAEYCDELQRLQMYTKCGVSLTGMGVSRRIVLTLTGTIITYELVLLSYRFIVRTMAPDLIAISTVES
ncbi:hypothetical protein pipiens_012815 [Culex pipiens pipiens]|uniref:Gustatory receptor n=1 Tax=Culex pipiens pipiens TaxID=38569 RepID=A0ABD1D0V9_CULPP